MGLVEPRRDGRREARRSAVGEVGLRRSEGPPVCRDLETHRLYGNEIWIDAFGASFEQQLLHDHLGHRVFAFTEVVVSDAAVGVRDVERRPEVIRERLPDSIVAVDGDRVLDPERARSSDDVVDVPLEPEFRGVHADHGQALVTIFLGPRRGDRAASGAS